MTPGHSQQTLTTASLLASEYSDVWPLYGAEDCSETTIEVQILRSIVLAHLDGSVLLQIR